MYGRVIANLEDRECCASEAACRYDTEGYLPLAWDDGRSGVEWIDLR